MKNSIVIKQIAEDIKETVRPLMEKWVTDRVNYLTNTRTWMHSDETKLAIDERYEDRKLIAGKYYMRGDARRSLYNEMGINQGDQQLIAYYSVDDWLIKAQKEALQKLMKIEVAVAKKIDFEVNSVEKLFCRNGLDGYMEGAWKLDNGKVFSFETFYAGGHNIQCLHVRTKYKLK